MDAAHRYSRELGRKKWQQAFIARAGYQTSTDPRLLHQKTGGPDATARFETQLRRPTSNEHAGRLRQVAWGGETRCISVSWSW